MSILRNTVSPVSGLSGESSPKYILGYTSDETVLLDFDNMRLKDVKYWARRTLKRFSLEGFLILESSPESYHVVFDRTVDWRENVRVIAWVALYVKKKSLDNWFKMQCIKQKPTLRVSKKHELGGLVKTPPRIVFSEGSNVSEIADYLMFRNLILEVSKEPNIY